MTSGTATRDRDEIPVFSIVQFFWPYGLDSVEHLDHALNGDDKPQMLGSSPRVRGTPAGCRSEPPEVRVHPRACGGHAMDRCGRGCSEPVHPRACGGHMSEQTGQCSRNRFIPARAGTPTGLGQNGTGEPVHPRACGGHTSRRWQEMQQERFIPARAGTLSPRNTGQRRQGPVQCRERLGGLLRYYHQEAA